MFSLREPLLSALDKHSSHVSQNSNTLLIDPIPLLSRPLPTDPANHCLQDSSATHRTQPPHSSVPVYCTQVDHSFLALSIAFLVSHQPLPSGPACHCSLHHFTTLITPPDSPHHIISMRYYTPQALSTTTASYVGRFPLDSSSVFLTPRRPISSCLVDHYPSRPVDGPPPALSTAPLPAPSTTLLLRFPC